MTAGLGIPRRAVLALAGLAAGRASARLASDPVVIAAGPDGSEAAAHARLLAPDLADALDSPAITLRFWGGQDGVTGLNRFAASAAPDGSEALLFPGSAPLAWLAGDDRVRADIFGLIPVLALDAPGLLLARPGRHAGMRLAYAGGPHAALAGLLGLQLLGVTAAPAPCGDDLSAVAGGQANAAFVCGPAAVARAQALREAGLAPLFALPAPGGGRDPAFPDVPSFLERLPPGAAGAPLARAWMAAAAASRAALILALPALTPAHAVGRWRRAAHAAALRETDLSPAVSPDGALARMRADAEAQLALRRWLAAAG